MRGKETLETHINVLKCIGNALKCIEERVLLRIGVPSHRIDRLAKGISSWYVIIGLCRQLPVCRRTELREDSSSMYNTFRVGNIGEKINAGNGVLYN